MDNTSKHVQYIFFGKVHPERCTVSIGEIGSAITTEGGEICGKLRFTIQMSQVTAKFICDKPVSNVFTLKNYVEDAIRVALDALGYMVACGYDLEMIEMIDSLGNGPIVFGVGIPAIEDAALSAGVSFESIVEVFKDPKGQYLQRCLADLREAIRVPKDTGFFCYRAIESLRQFFIRETGAKNKEASWEMLRYALETERSEIDAIMKFAEPIRHGDSIPISDSQRGSTLKLTWNIVNKFIKYANAGYTNS